jgi:hypothetical protein
VISAQFHHSIDEAPASSRASSRLWAFARWTFMDRLLVVCIAAFGAVAMAALLIAPHFLIPAEDAVILFQYSRNLALHGAIAYIPHGVHAEGATDFLWMVMIALGIKLGANPLWFVAIINVMSLGGLAFILLRIAGERFRIVPACFIAGSFALFPQISAAAVGFSAFPFACMLAWLALVFLQKDDVATPAVALLLCLFRPDGIVFVVPLLCAALILYPNRFRRLKLDATLFVLPGLAYFLWRWHYFHSLLPLPFLVKSDTARVAHLLVPASFTQARLMLSFAAAVLCIALWKGLKDARNIAILLCFIVLPNLFYFSMRLDQDIGRRFFIYIPVGTAVLIAMNLQRLVLRSTVLLRVGFIAWLLFVQRVSFAEAATVWPYQFTNRKAIAEDLARLPHGTMIVTEAGILPYYSGWTAYDAWGLNTQSFATQLAQPSDVASINPDVMLVYNVTNTEQCAPQADWHVPYTDRTWDHMTRNLISGAPPASYDLQLLPFGNTATLIHGKHECWFVRRNSPLHDAVMGVLAAHGSITYERYRELNPLVAVSTQTITPVLPAHHRLHTMLGKLWHSVDE